MLPQVHFGDTCSFNLDEKVKTDDSKPKYGEIKTIKVRNASRPHPAKTRPVHSPSSSQTRVPPASAPVPSSPRRT